MYDENYNDDEWSESTVFTLNGKPIPIYLHHSLGSGGRKAMARKIKDAGGNPDADEDNARVIICRHNTPTFNKLEHTYDHDRYKWVEPPSWVDSCIMNGRYEHLIHIKKTVRGSGARTEFTSEDDENLVNYLARRIPFKDTGGRQGNEVYKDLCSPQRAYLYPWATRHPWQSWRERYKKNQDVFDSRIAFVVDHELDPPVRGGKGQYVIQWYKKKPKPLRYSVQYEEEEEEEEIGEEENEQLQEGHETYAGPANKRPRLETHSKGPRHFEGRQDADLPLQERTSTLPDGADSDDDETANLGHVRRKRKSRRIPTESEPEYTDNIPGPSQMHEEPVALPPSSLSAQPAFQNEATRTPRLNVPLHDVPEVVIPALPRNRGSNRPPNTPGLEANAPPDSQATLALAPTQRPPDSTRLPADTQATVVPLSPPPRRPRGRPRKEHRRLQESAPDQPIAHNTRSGRVRGSDNEAAQPNTRRLRPRARAQPDEAPLSRRHSPEAGHASTSGPGNASFREEVQVLEILDVSAVDNGGNEARARAEEGVEGEPAGGGDHNDSQSGVMSSDDDAAARTLREKNNAMLQAAAREGEGEGGRAMRLRSGDAVLIPSMRKLPHIDVFREATRGRRKKPTPVLQASPVVSRSTGLGGSAGAGAVSDPDPDATPRANPSATKKAAKKTAARDSLVVLRESESNAGSDDNDGDDDDSDRDEDEDRESEMTGSSFPVERTNARDYKDAQAPFTPARGTKADERMRGEESRSRTRSRRARS